jgi:lysozyme family protein
MSLFDTAYEATQAHEGGYANDPDDRGGETYRGIARIYHPDWAGWDLVDRALAELAEKGVSDLREMSEYMERDRILSGHVKLFYHRNFWTRIRGDELIDERVAIEVFDTAVNMGVHRAVQIVQEGLNLLSTGGSLVEDGLIGRNTLHSLRDAIQRGHTGALLKLLNHLQAEHYIVICRRNPSQKKFLRGWLKRT